MFQGSDNPYKNNKTNNNKFKAACRLTGGGEGPAPLPGILNNFFIYSTVY